jgi:type II secretory pathway pseudopilin PulG
MEAYIVNGNARPSNRHEQGFTYLAVLFLVAILSATLAATGTMWSTAQQREKESDLLFIGNQFRNAIGAYYEKTPGSIKRYPNSLKELLQDNRRLAMNRYLRKIYADPITGNADWGVVHSIEGGIIGVYSLSDKEPLKKSFDSENPDFDGADKYRDWRFVYVPDNSIINTP